MVRAGLSIAVIACCLGAGQASRGQPVVRVGGTPYALISGQGSLWVLTCDRGCSGEARHAVGRVVRIDPRTARVVASALLPRPHAIAVGARGVYALDFWRDRVRLIDPRSLRVVRSLKLKLPFRFSARDNAFVPFAVAVGGGAVWVATDRGALARADLGLTHVDATVRLPFDAFGGMAAGPNAVWLGESLAGIYRVDRRTNRVTARIRIGRFDATDPILCGGNVLVLGVWTKDGALTRRFSLARVLRDRAEIIAALPPEPYAFTCSVGSLWVGQSAGSTLMRIDPRTGTVLGRRHARIGMALAFAGGHLWTAFADGTVRQLGR